MDGGGRADEGRGGARRLPDARARSIIEEMRGLDTRFVFPSLMRPGNPLCNMALLMTLHLDSAEKLKGDAPLATWRVVRLAEQAAALHRGINKRLCLTHASATW